MTTSSILSCNQSSMNPYTLGSIPQPNSPLLLSIPISLLNYVGEFCNWRETIALESTTRYAHIATREIWIKHIAYRNLFIFPNIRTLKDLATSINTHTIDLFKLYEQGILKTFVMKSVQPLDTPEPKESTVASPNESDLDLAICLNKPHIQQYILNANVPSIVKHAHNPSPKTPHISNLKTFLLSRRQNSWKKIFFQIMAQDESWDQQNPVSIADFTKKALNMIFKARNYSQNELFTFLQNYIIYQTNRSENLSHFNFYEMLKHVRDRKPELLQSFITALKIDEVQINAKMSSKTSSLILEELDGKTLLRYAVERADSRQLTKNLCGLKAIKVLIKAGADIAEPGIMKYAVTCSSLDVVNTLIARKANPNQMEEGRPLLEQALCHGSTRRSPYVTQSVVSALLSANSDPNGRNSENQTTLMCAVKHCTDQMFQFFKQQKPNLSLTDNFGYTALIHAVSTPDCLQKIKTLLVTRSFSIKLDGETEYGFQRVPAKEVNHRDHAGQTALMHAVNADQTEMLSYLQTLLDANADVDLIDNNEDTAFALARKRDLPDTITKLLRPTQFNVLVPSAKGFTSLKPKEPNLSVLPMSKKRKEQEVTDEPSSVKKNAIDPTHFPLPNPSTLQHF